MQVEVADVAAVPDTDAHLLASVAAEWGLGILHLELVVRVARVEDLLAKLHYLLGALIALISVSILISIYTEREPMLLNWF